MLDRCPVPIFVIWIFVENVCVLLLYLLLTWLFENGPGTSPYAVHASVFRSLKGLKPFRNFGAKTGIQEPALLELENRRCLFLVPRFDTNFWWPVLLQHPSPYQQEPNQKTVNAKYAMQRRKRPTWWEGGSGRYAMLFGQGNKHGESDDGSTCLSGRKASIKVSIDHLQAFVFEGNDEIWGHEAGFVDEESWYSNMARYVWRHQNRRLIQKAQDFKSSSTAWC